MISFLKSQNKKQILQWEYSNPTKFPPITAFILRKSQSKSSQSKRAVPPSRLLSKIPSTWFNTKQISISNQNSSRLSSDFDLTGRNAHPRKGKRAICLHWNDTRNLGKAVRIFHTNISKQIDCFRVNQIEQLISIETFCTVNRVLTRRPW